MKLPHVHQPPKRPMALHETLFSMAYWPNRQSRRAARAWMKKLSGTSHWEDQYALWCLTQQ